MDLKLEKTLIGLIVVLAAISLVSRIYLMSVPFLGK